MKTLCKNLALLQQFWAPSSLQRSTFALIFQPILHRFRSNIGIYTSSAVMDLLCEFGVIWIKTEGAFH